MRKITAGIFAGLAAFTALVCATSLTTALDSNSGNVVAIGQYFSNVPMTGITRPANVTGYTINQLVCGATCTPMTLTLVANPQAQGVQATLANRVLLTKSGATTTGAQFTLFLFSQPPTVPSGGDQAAYVGPYTTDLKSYLGQATCTTPVATNDASASVWFECALGNPNSAGVTVFQRQPTGTQVYGMLQYTGTAYTPASAEVFTAYLSGVF